jgi:KDO2-lipid IV(A) lauroyltransferase
LGEVALVRHRRWPGAGARAGRGFRRGEGALVANALGKLILPLLYALAWGLSRLPIALQSALGDLLGALLRAVSFRARVIRQNLEIAYPGPDDGRRRQTLFRSAYRHLGRLVLEILLVFGQLKRDCLLVGQLRGNEHWRAALEKGHGALFLSSHVGNWEIMAAVGAVQKGIDLMLVTKKLKPEWLHQAIEKGRADAQVLGTYEPRTFRDVLRHLKRGGTVGFVLDQYAGPPVGIRVPFFGTPVGTQTAVAILAKRTGAPVVPVVNYREPNGRLTVEIFPALEWIADPDPQREIALNTAHYASVIEAHVRAHPDQWLWTHRRFKGELGPLRPDEWSEGRGRS